jgi:BirA family biotin operon repressor/biotin-[acetyl-CoA-carboxylase] ligase
MSIIVRPRYSLLQQPLFNCAITVAIATVIADLSQHWSLQVKWPNDIILNDKKAGGILIENVIRGSEWLLSIIGFGLNINQSFMPDELPFATSLFIEAGLNFENDALLYAVRNSVLAALSSSMPSASIMNSYNNLLFRRDQLQAFAKDSVPFTARISHVLPNGQIVLILGDGSEVAYTHGDISWQWG